MSEFYNETVCIISEFSLIEKTIIKYHKFTLPSVGHRYFYRDRFSYDAFFKKRRNYDKTRMFAKSVTANRPIAIIEHADIWEFYKAIDYDPTRKRYGPPKPFKVH